MRAVKKLVLLLLVIGAAAAWWFIREAPVRYVYQTQPVLRGSITATISATGKVDAVEMVEVGTQVSGTIKEIYADYNSEVSKGQLIALLDPDVLQSRVEEAKAGLVLAQAGVERSKASLTDAERAYKRSRELWERSLVARSELDTAETTLILARASLSESNAKVVQAQATLRQAEVNLGYTRIVSPVDGVVISRQVEVGQTVAASLQTPTLFSIARDLTQMRIEASIDEADIGRIADGQRAVCKFDAWPKEEFEGRVAQVRLAPEIVSNVVTYTVVLNIANPDMKLKPGMTANVTIITEERDNVIKIAAAALRFTPPADALPERKQEQQEGNMVSPLGMPRMPRRSAAQKGGEQAVWVVENGRLAGSVPITEQGISDRTWIEIPNSPLREGQELAVSYEREGA
ncbi:MAG: efflux RND transporter periplasmic adaptor subunit [Synergistaceae bacterium]|jgi:HlyD family secretion protein|nr:efflux RND transporter periplasmic adaptor subunit [Synergistaceae bacterium]